MPAGHSPHRPRRHVIAYDFKTLAACNQLIAEFFGMSVRAYKLVKAVTQLVAVAAGVYAMSLGAAPMLTFILVATIVSGPEVAEILITKASEEVDAAADDTSQDRL